MTLTGDGLAGVIQSLTLNAAAAASIPLVVSRAAARRLRAACAAASRPSSESSDHVLVDLVQRALGRARRHAARGAPTSTATSRHRSTSTARCARTSRATTSPPRTSPASARGCPCSRSSAAPTRRTRSATSPGSLRRCRRARVVVVPGQGHGVGQYGCLPDLVARFVERGEAPRRSTSAAREGSRRRRSSCARR